MITLIGTSSTLIGFGLCGIEKVREVTPDMTPADIQALVDAADSRIIMIEENIYKTLERVPDRIVIRIPDPEAERSGSDIDRLVQDVVGASITLDGTDDE